jgi:hypothetical protein
MAAAEEFTDIKSVAADEKDAPKDSTKTHKKLTEKLEAARQWHTYYSGIIVCANAYDAGIAPLDQIPANEVAEAERNLPKLDKLIRQLTEELKKLKKK